MRSGTLERLQRVHPECSGLYQERGDRHAMRNEPAVII